MPKISVIVPIYGVEKYIERCTKSLMEQTLDNMEFVFVSDATKDNSINILKETIRRYPERATQVKIIEKEKNEGCSYARKTGVEQATGEYIGFCDGDDWVDRTMYEKMYKLAKTNDCDFVKCGHYSTDGHDILSTNTVNISNKPAKMEMLSQLLRCKGINSIWDTISKRELFIKNDIHFTPHSMLEDFFLTTQLIEYSSSYSIIQEPLYYYFKNNNSICNASLQENYIKRAKDAQANIRWILKFIERRYGKKFANDEVILKYIPRKLMIPIMTNMENYRIWNTLFPGNTIKLLISPHTSYKYKLQYLLVEFRLYKAYKSIMSK